MSNKSTLVKKACSDNNPLKLDSYASSTWKFVFTKNRTTNKDYTIILRNESGNNIPFQIINKTYAGFTIKGLFDLGFITATVESGGWGFDIFEYDV